MCSTKITGHHRVNSCESIDIVRFRVRPRGYRGHRDFYIYNPC